VQVAFIQARIFKSKEYGVLHLPHNVALITTLVAALGAALAFGFLAARFKLPVLVGYLAAGIVIGPFTPGFVADAELSAQFAEIGVMLLMFGVGLHFSIDELLAVRKIAVPGAIVQITVATLLGLALSNLWGWNLVEGLVFGLTLSVASTVVLLRALESRGILETVNGHIAVGWLIVEDLVTVLVLVLLPPLSLWLGGSGGGQVSGQELFTALALTLGKVALFIGFMVIAGRRLVPWIAWHIARVGPRELFTLCVIAIAMGIAYGAAELFGVSFALGAFFAGMVMRESPLSHRAAEESLPFRDSFSVLFFVSVGMLFDPQVLVHEPLHIMAVVAIIVIGKSLAAFVLVLLFGYPLNTALTVSAGLAQIGEFSFILAGLGLSLGILPEEARSLILAGAIISIAVNPLVFQAIEPLQVWIRAKSKRAQLFERSEDPLATLPMSVDLNRLSGHVVLVGYGRVGRRIGAALAAQGISFVLAEENREIIQAAREKGIAAVSGDATEPMVLVQAHIHRARMLVIATPDTLNVRRMIEIARTVNLRIETVVRTHSEEEAELLEKEHAGKIFLGEHELARSMSEYVIGRYAVKVEQAV
jgi:CPA2 family monovalent cation:H+ antiporter-2